MARAVEAAVREEGAEPATIAIVDGIVRVGLDDATRWSGSPRPMAWPNARRAIWPLVMAAGGWARPRSPGTIRIAAAAGIRVMATGGIGGVHRGGETSLDVSADLHELARTGVAVVCSGAKIILDLPRTLEVLETLAVPVVGYRCDSFPAFYARDSGLPVPERRRVCPAWRRWSAPRPTSAGRPASWSPTRRQPSWRCPCELLEGWIAQAPAEAQSRASAARTPRRSCSRRWRG